MVEIAKVFNSLRNKNIIKTEHNVCLLSICRFQDVIMETKSARRGLSIVIKVSILAASIAALASFIVGTLILNGSSKIVYDNALSRLKYETNIKSLKLLSDIKNLGNDAQYLVGSPPIQGIPRAIKHGGIDSLDGSSQSVWENRLVTIFTELIRAKSNYLQIRYIGVADQGKELVRVERYGKTIRNTPEKERQQKSDTTYFKRAIKLSPGEVYLSDITLNREFGKISEPYTPVIRAATPVYFEDQLFGILVINMSFKKIFHDLINNTPRELTPYVINEEGYFLAHPNDKMVFGFDLGNENKIQTTYNDFALPKYDDIRDLELTVETDKGVIHVVKNYYHPEQKSRFFAVLLSTSYENLNSGADQLRMKSFIMMGVLVLLSTIVSAVLVYRLMHPLQLIAKASEDLANGREVSDLSINTAGEIGDLACSFDNMRHQLEDKEREIIISQGRVHHANKMASLGEMASGMAHEINSPIQAISMTAERVQRKLKKHISSDDIDTSMENIICSVKKVSDIIESLRKVSRDSTKDDFIDINVGILIEDIEKMTEERFKVNNVSFEVNYHDMSKNTIVQCQRLQISQVLINLVNNAYDAIYEMNSKWITIDVRKMSNKVIFSVTDSGEGVPENLIDKIFEPMFTSKEIGKGTGLGLSISQEIAINHNGLLYVDMEYPHTRFVLEFPLVHVV